MEKMKGIFFTFSVLLSKPGPACRTCPCIYVWYGNHNDLKTNFDLTSYPVTLFMQAMLILISQRSIFD